MATKLTSLLLRAFLVRGKARAFTKIPSVQLQDALNTLELTDTTGRINVPHFWARWFHDGRGPAIGNPLLIWFRDPADDPRLPGGRYPVKRSQVKHLTGTQLRRWNRINQKIISAYKRSTGKRDLDGSDYRAMKLPMIIAKRSPGKSDFVTGVPFFSNSSSLGMMGFRKEANDVGKRITSQFVTERLQSQGLLHMKLTKTIRI
jgi:hypothetical protein